MKKAILFLAGALCSCAAVPTSELQEEVQQQSMALYIGSADFSGDWDDGDVDLTTHDSFGFEYACVAPESGNGFEVGYQMTDTDDISDVLSAPINLKTTEIYVGVRAPLDNGTSPFVPVIGGGLMVLDGKLSARGFNSVDDSTVAPYVHFGMDYVQDSGFRVGWDYRMVFGAEVSANGFEADADYKRFALKMGFSF